MTEKRTLSLPTKTKLSVGGRPTLTASANTAKVEVTKKRSFERDKYGKLIQKKSLIPNESTATPEVDKDLPASNLSEQERLARMDALKNAAKSQEQMNEDRNRIQQLEDKEKQRQAQLREVEQKLRKDREEENKRKEEERRTKENTDVANKDTPTAPAKTTSKSKDALFEEEVEREKKKFNSSKPAVRNESKKLNKVLLTRALDSEEDEGRQRSIASIKRARAKEKLKNKSLDPQEKIIREVILPETITVGDLALRMSERLSLVIKSLMKMGMIATQHQIIDADTAELVISEFGHKMKRVSDSDVENVISDYIDSEESLKPRPPVVTIMGHVDHGKTSLLDALRLTDVVSGEAGGITQHIGAYQVMLSDHRVISFLDTPGHEAFTAMRARGSKVTDIVVLVVAADDGVRPQTIEAINHAQAANVPLIIAVNKCDKAEANPNRVYTELLSHEVVVEAMGGDVQAIEISATKKINLDILEEAILLQAEILELKANPHRLAHGVIIESRQEKGRGNVATVLVQKGTLKKGDIFIAGTEWGKVRTLLNDQGVVVKEVSPSQPVQVIGFNGLPEAGNDFAVVDTEMQAREISEYRSRKKKDNEIAKLKKSSLENIFDNIQDGGSKNCPVVIKTDVQGSLEALRHSLEKLDTDEVKIQILHGAVGGITETDITLAASSSGIVFGFNVRATPQARELAKKEGVEIRYYSIIYELIDDTKMLMSGFLKPEEREEFLGYAEIRKVFFVSNVGKVAGCMVTEGLLRRGCKVRLLRDNVVIYDGNLKQLKRFQNDAKEVASGYECGLSLENYNDLKEKDLIECYHVLEIKRHL